MIDLADVCVIGLGKIGLPLALLLAKANHRVVGIDSSSSKLNTIRNKKLMGKKSVEESALILRHINKNLYVTGDLSKVLESEVVFIAIGTGVGVNGAPDLSNIFKLIDNLCIDSLNIKGKVFVIKSTVPIGTTRKIAGIIEEKTGLSCGVDFFVVFCPERVLGNKALSEMESLPKVIGGIESYGLKKAAEIYSTIGGKIIEVCCPEFAEMVKLLDNAYRQTLFAFANDFALLAEKWGMNAYDIIKVANDSYPRNNIPFPSGGVSGYCLTKDPIYLEVAFKDIAIKRGFNSVWFNARKTNDYMPVHMVNLLKQKLDVARRKMSSSNVVVCGIAYKENTDDVRNSHGLEIASKLCDEGANVLVWDPQVKEENSRFEVINKLEEVLRRVDALVFTVKHDEFLQLNDTDYILNIVAKMRTPIIIDGWGIFQSLIGRQDILYASIGIKS